MPDGSTARRLSWDVSGLEDPGELVSRLEQSTARVQALTRRNEELAARVRDLERKVGGAGRLTNDELIAELPKRMTEALQSAQEVETEIVERAKKRDAMVRRRVEHEAARLLERAQARAATVHSRAAEEAAAHLEAARAQAVDIVSTAYALQAQIVAELGDQYAMLEQRLLAFEDNRRTLLEAYEAVERRLGEGKRALRTELPPLLPTAIAAVRALEPEADAPPALGRGDRADPPDPPAVPSSASAPPATRPADVFDWSTPGATGAGSR